ncbi:ATP-grasp domain-containing protein [Deinococcus aluminii]|uniref:D-alanine--D-alanine ligase n=1 Tax=Deinococcus aluminii TaxID=1656885 RepID=A0ABP9XIT0_9DEIO
MTRHIVYCDLNAAGLQGVETALDEGLDVSLISSPMSEGLLRGERGQHFLNRLLKHEQVSDVSDAGQLAEALRAIQQVKPVDAAFTVLEYASLATAKACKAVGLQTTRPEAVALARDKARCKAVLSAAGLDTGFSRVVQGFNEAQEVMREQSYPVVVKPNNGAGSLGAAIVHSDEELHFYFRQVAKTMPGLSAAQAAVFDTGYTIEEYLEGPLVSVEVLSTMDQVIPLMVSGRKRARYNEVLELGTTMPAFLPEEDTLSCQAYAARIIDILDLRPGIMHIELIITSQGPRLVEVNPRLMGASLPSLYQNATRQNIYSLLHAAHLNTPPPAIQPASRASVSRVIAPRAHAVVRTPLTAAELMAWHPDIIRADMTNLEPGQGLPPMTSNHGSIGFFQVAGESSEQVTRLADQLIHRAEEYLGFELAK